MDTRTLHRGFAVLAFAIALITYYMTVQPSVPFWDCGEFTAAAVWQQVPHPPGAPLFLLIAKLFDMLPIGGDPGWRVNLTSVVSSAFTVLLTYLIIVKMIAALREKEIGSFGDALSVYGSAFIGATAYTFSDTFWFNAVESEVYAMSTLFVALIIWLIMLWNEQADTPGNERYLMLIIYLVGLSTGVHLFSILTLFTVALIVYFRRYPFKISTFLLTGVISVVAFGIIYPGIVKILPSMLGGDFGRTEAREYIFENSLFIRVIAVAILLSAVGGVLIGFLAKKPILKLFCSAFLFVILGYSSYTHILLRSNANPPMNENTPNSFERLTSYVNREQYGDAPSWPRRYQQNEPYETHHHRYDSKSKKWTPPPTKRVERRDGTAMGAPDYSKMKVDFAGEMRYLFSYQIYDMYIRYFLWNFVGKTGDVQDAPWEFIGSKKSQEYNAYNYASGYKNDFPIRFFALPFLAGLIGMFYHYQRDPKRAFAFTILFLMMGALAAYAQNQQSPQPRERDYFYVGSFMTWCMWIGLGIYSIAEQLGKKNSSLSVAALAIGFLLVPANMAMGGWRSHSRAGNFLPFDYSYNVLQSLEKDAIVFTYGDNDTFPLWYMQDVAGVRRDVRVVNLSLGQTGWYIYELKNREPWGAKRIKLSFSDESLLADETDKNAISPTYSPSEQITVKVSSDILSKYTSNPSIINSGVMTFIFTASGNKVDESNGKPIYFNGVQNQLVRDIIEQNHFERPVYFTPGSESYMGLDNFLRWEGLSYKVCPVEQGGSRGKTFNEEVMAKCLLNPLPFDEVHTEPHYGFKFRNLNNMAVYYDEVARRFMDSYRMVYLEWALNTLNTLQDNKKTVAILDAMNNNVSPKQFPMPYALCYQMADMYQRAGAQKQANEYAQMAIDLAQPVVDLPYLRKVDRYADVFSPEIAISRSYVVMGNYTGAKAELQKMLAQSGGSDPQVQFEIDDLELQELEHSHKYAEAATKANELANKYRAMPEGGQIANQFQLRALQYQTKIAPEQTTITDSSKK